MDTQNFSPTMIEAARAHIAALFDGVNATLSLKPTVASLITVGDRAFASRYTVTNMNIATYDLFMGRMSAIWPDDAAWPEGVPRPHPVALDEGGAAILAEKIAKRPPPTKPNISAEDWPEDIPRPATL